MKRSLKELQGYSVEAKDGTKGKVKDFLFDYHRWVIRYLEADLGTFFSGKKVLVPRMFLKEPKWESQHFPVSLTKEAIESCPELSTNMPVSQKYEQELTKYYGVGEYWNNMYVPPAGAPVYIYPPGVVKTPDQVINEKDLDSRLRSYEEVKGYYVKAIDKELGHIDDLIINDADWQILYAVVDTSNWLPWSKRVLIGVQWMTKISYVDQTVSINLHSDTIKKAPEFDPSKPVNEVYEKQLYDFYGREVVRH